MKQERGEHRNAKSTRIQLTKYFQTSQVCTTSSLPFQPRQVLSHLFLSCLLLLCSVLVGTVVSPCRKHAYYIDTKFMICFLKLSWSYSLLRTFLKVNIIMQMLEDEKNEVKPVYIYSLKEDVPGYIIYTICKIKPSVREKHHSSWHRDLREVSPAQRRPFVMK